MPAVQARHAAPLLPATPAADILGVDAAYDKRPPLGLPCEPATRRLGSAAPTGCRAQLYVRLKHLGRLVQHSRLSTDKVFFIHADDGIRDLYVTGVQTCALPIYGGLVRRGGSSLTARLTTRLHGESP